MEVNNTKKIWNAYDTTLVADDVVAYHGTSLSCLRKIVEKGFMTGSTLQGEVFLFPIQGRTLVRGNDTKPTCGGYEGMELDAAKGYANRTEWREFLAERLQLNLEIESEKDIYDQLGYFVEEYKIGSPHTNKSLHRICPEVEGIYDFLLEKGYDDKKMDALINEARQRQGVVLGFSEHVFARGFSPGHLGNDVRVLTPSIDTIVGIEPLDVRVKSYLDSLDPEQ